MRWHGFVLGGLFALAAVGAASSAGWAGEVDQLITQANRERNVTQSPMPIVDDLAFLRRAYVDLVARIPTEAEIREFQAWPAASRRAKLVDKLLADERFVDRFTTFLADMLRVRSTTPGGPALMAYVRQAVADGMPYDELSRKLITANGRANRTPEVGFILGDDADPMAMASVTSQVFMGVRMGCAQCHDHPFDVWKREDFYGLAAYYGKTRRVESQLTRVIYTMEASQTTILWPPEGMAPDNERKPMTPRFPVPLAKFDGKPDHIARLEAHRLARQPKAPVETGPSIDDLLADAGDKAAKTASAALPDQLDVAGEATRDIRKIDINASVYGQSPLRAELASFITSPANRYFSRALVNRVWKEFVGQGFVEPVDDFRQDNPASHAAALDYLADEFVANGYDFRRLTRAVVLSEAYQRGHAPGLASEAERAELERAFLATPMRRMLSEALYDSIVVAGHLFDFKHRPGQNLRTISETVRVPKTGESGADAAKNIAAALTQEGRGQAMTRSMAKSGGGYAVEDAIEADFAGLLAAAGEDEISLEKMEAMSAEELEAQRMAMERMNRAAPNYIEKTVSRVVDSNPKFNSALRMAESPAPPGHFLRVFGQPTRFDLGEPRDDAPTMRQALLMLNGRLTHEASRVGELEPLHALLVGPKADPAAAVKLAYREILTREPSADEVADALAVIRGGADALDGMADLRWVLLNSNEFRFLP